MPVISVFQGYSLIYDAYEEAIGHENKQIKNKEDAVWGKPEKKWEGS